MLKIPTRTCYSYAALTLAMLFLGLTIITGKILSTSFPIFGLLLFRFAVGTSVIFTFIYFTKPCVSNKDIFLTKMDWIILLLQALFGGFLFNVLLLYGLQFSSATTAGIITSANPFFTVILGYLFLKEEMSFKKVGTVTLAILGIVILNTNGSFKNPIIFDIKGNILLTLAVIAGACYTIAIKKMADKMSSYKMAAIFNLFSLLLFIPLVLLQPDKCSYLTIPLSSYGIAVLYALFGSVMFPILWNYGVSNIKASTASLFTGLSPIFTAGIAYIALNENINLMQVIGGIIVVTAIIIDSLLTAKFK